MWVARNKDNTLILYKNKPVRVCLEINDNKDKHWCTLKQWYTLDYSNTIELDNKLFPELQYEDDPIEVSLNIEDYNNLYKNNLDNVFKELSKTHDPDKALELCKLLKGKCFIREIYNKFANRSFTNYIKIYDIKAIDGYVVATTNMFCKTNGPGTFNLQDRYEFLCKDNSETILWSQGTHGPFYTYEELVMPEISNEEYIEKAKELFNEYLKNEIM